MHLRRLHADFGAEVLGLDLAADPAPDVLADLRAAYDEHQLLLFRRAAPLAPARQLAVSSWFGVCNTEAAQKHTFMDNAEAIGRERLQFHSDNSYAARPIEGISLHALELPRTGAVTCFVSGVAAWARLSAERQRELTPLTARHHLPTSIMPDWPDLTGDHPVRLTHPRTGRDILYVTQHHAARIHELAPAQSDALLADLFAHLYAPERIYTHAWSLHDFLIWDNLALQHARPEAADLSDGKRLLQRVTLGGAPFSEILADAKLRAAAG